MRIGFALLVVPLLALADQSVSYVIAGWACAHQDTWIAHGVHASFLLVAGVGTVVAWRIWRESSASQAANEALARQHFLAGLATGSAALSLLVILAMWGVSWVLRSCIY